MLRVTLASLAAQSSALALQPGALHTRSAAAVRGAVSMQVDWDARKAAEEKERENELRHHLELITNIAQRIDNENRALTKKNA